MERETFHEKSPPKIRKMGRENGVIESNYLLE
jgi:hypothetical protein